MSRRITFADLDALLCRLGFTRRDVEVARGGMGENGSGETAGQTPSRRAGLPAVLYHNPDADDARILLPRRPPDEPAEPQHLIPTRRQLIERGLISEEEFDRWLCAMRFGEVCREPVGSEVGSAAHDAAHRPVVVDTRA